MKGWEGKRTEKKGRRVKRGKGTQIIKSKSGSSLIGRGRKGRWCDVHQSNFHISKITLLKALATIAENNFGRSRARDKLILSMSRSCLIGRGRMGDEVLSDACAPVSISITQK